jgi:hypothetical protein
MGGNKGVEEGVRYWGAGRRFLICPRILNQSQEK